MITHTDLTKIQKFVQQQMADSESVVISKRKNGYQINNFQVKPTDEQWSVSNVVDRSSEKFDNLRVAILSAACKSKNKSTTKLTEIDMRLTAMKYDQYFFESKISMGIRPELYQDRLSRLSVYLNMLYSEISVLEKSVGLL